MSATAPTLARTRNGYGDAMTHVFAGEKHTEGMQSIPGGEFLMGSEDFYPEARPVHRVEVDAARQGEALDPSTGHIGFRWVRR